MARGKVPGPQGPEEKDQPEKNQGLKFPRGKNRARRAQGKIVRAEWHEEKYQGPRGPKKNAGEVWGKRDVLGENLGQLGWGLLVSVHGRRLT